MCVFKIGCRSEFLLFPIENLKMKLIYIKKKFLVKFEELLNAVELVMVEDAHSDCFTRYGMKTNILECCVRFMRFYLHNWVTTRRLNRKERN